MLVARCGFSGMCKGAVLQGVCWGLLRRRGSHVVRSLQDAVFSAGVGTTAPGILICRQHF